MGAFESGQALIAGVLAKLPESQRAQAKAIFEAAEAKDAVTVIGDSTLARSDYSRQMDDLRAEKETIAAHQEQLNAWFTNNKGALEEYVRIKPEYDTLKTNSPNAAVPQPKPPVAYDPEEVKRIALEAIGGTGADYVQLTAFMLDRAGEHQQRFGEPLRMQELTSHPKLGKQIVGQPAGRIFSLEDAYKEKYGEQLAARAKADDDKRIETEVQRRLGEERSKHGNHPFPLRSEASVLDILNDANNKTSNYTVDTAVAEYDRLQSQRST